MTTWRSKAERGSAWLIRLIAWLARTTGRRSCRALLYPIVAYFVLTDGMARRASVEFLNTVRGRRPGLRDTFAHIYSFAATLLDRVYMAAGDFGRFEVTIQGQDLFERALRTGRGCLLLGSHLGSFDLMILAQRALDKRPIRINIMMRIDPRSRVRQIAGVDESSWSLIPMGRPESFLRAHETLTAGGVVAILADRVDGAASLPVRFLGRPTRMPIAPHLLASRSGSTVLMFFGLYEGGNRYRIEFVEFGPAAAAGSRGAALQPALDRYATILDQYARRHPLNWFNFYPYWKHEESHA